MKMVGERALNPVMDGIDDLRKTKVKEEYEKATIKCKMGGPAPKPAAPPAAAAPPKKKAPASKPKATPVAEEELIDDAPAKPLAKPPARLAVGPFLFS
jgi:cytoskeleton-associated protein 5